MSDVWVIVRCGHARLHARPYICVYVSVRTRPSRPPRALLFSLESKKIHSDGFRIKAKLCQSHFVAPPPRTSVRVCGAKSQKQEP